MPLSIVDHAGESVDEQVAPGFEVTLYGDACLVVAVGQFAGQRAEHAAVGAVSHRDVLHDEVPPPPEPGE